MSVLWSKEIDEKRSLVIHKTKWMYLPLIPSWYWKFGWKQRPSKLHANIQLILVGWEKFNGGWTARLGNLELTYRWN